MLFPRIVIVGWIDFNILGVDLSMLYLCMMYMLVNWRIGVFQSDHVIAWRWYQDGFRLNRATMVMTHIQQPNVYEVNVMDVKLIADPQVQ